MNFLPLRLAVWFVTLALFPIPLPLVGHSFQVEVLQRITLAALPLSPESERPGVELTEHVLEYLEQAEKTEIDPWVRDDLRISWITVQWAQHGVPEWSWRRNSSPYVAATYQVLHCDPDEVWPRILKQRAQKLGALHAKVFGAASSPRKPVRSVDLAEYERRRRKAA
jgi:hypothetical protein